MNTLRLGIMTDLHVILDAGTKLYRPGAGAVDPLTDPLDALSKQADERRTDFEVDWLCCLGDIGNAADPGAIQHGWMKVADLGKRIARRGVIAASGNHDVDSRRLNDKHDPFDVLRFRLADYPVADELERFRYWAKHYAIIEDDLSDARIVVINTASLHTDVKLAENGTFSRSAVDSLRQELDSRPPRRVSVLLCHHHPYRHGDVDRDDYSALDNAEELVALLDSKRRETWLIVHGHKHRPHLMVAPGGTGAPVLFSAGSFSGPLYPEISGVGNQFYRISIDPNAASELGLGLAGRFESWTWRVGHGWEAIGGKGLPPSGGFGSRQHPSRWVKDIRGTIKEPYSTWTEVEEALPELRYVAPADLAVLLDELKKAGVRVLFEDGEICQLAP